MLASDIDMVSLCTPYRLAPWTVPGNATVVVVGGTVVEVVFEPPEIVVVTDGEGESETIPMTPMMTIARNMSVDLIRR